MTTARSSFSFSRVLPFYRNMLRRHRGSALFYGALGFLFLPVQYLLTILQNQDRADLSDFVRWTFSGPAQIYNGFSAFFFTALMLVVPLIVAVNLFSYLHNRRSVDVYHSLPLTRCELYAACCMTGITLIWAPLAVNFLLTAAVSFLLPGASAGMILLDLLCWMAVTLAIFAITAFCAVQLGTDFDTAIFSLGLNGVFAAVYLMFMMLGDSFIYGFSAGDGAIRLAYRLSPVSLIIGRVAIARDSLEYLAENNVSMLFWFAAALLVLGAGAWCYTRRRSEQAEAVGEMGPLQIFMRSAGTLLGGTGLGMILCAVFEIHPEDSRFLSLFCIAVGSLIVYFIGDVILSRSVRSIPKALPVAAVTTAGVCVLVGVMLFDLIGIGRWVPQVSHVEEARLYYYNSRFSDQPSLGQDRSMVVAFQDPEAVALVIAAQQKQIDLHYGGERAGEDEDFYSGHGSLRVTYEMTDGHTVSRRYYNLYPETLDQLVRLETDDEMISQTHPAFAANADMIHQVTVVNTLGSSSEDLILDAAQKERLLVALRKDLLSQPLEELKNGATAVCTLTVEYRYPRETRTGSLAEAEYVNGRAEWDEEYYHAASNTILTESYRNTLALLRELGAAQSIENNWSDVKAAYVLPFNREYDSRTITQTDLNRVAQTRDDLEDFLNPENRYEGAEGLNMQSFALSKMELNALRSELTSTAPNYGEPFAVIGIAAGEEIEEMTGYYLVPVSALPEHLKQAVAQMVRGYYGTYAVESWGYGNVGVTWVATESVA